MVFTTWFTRRNWACFFGRVSQIFHLGPGGVVVLEVLVGDGKLDAQADLPTVARVL